MRGIYCIKNIKNNKIYIGQTNDIDIRWKNHINMLKRNAHTNIHLQNAWNKYGENSFEFSVIYEATEDDNLNSLEKYYIKLYNANDENYGYNLTDGGEGYKLSEEVKNKMSINGRGKNSNLTEEQVAEIKIMMANGIDRKTIAEKFSVSRKVLTNISTGKNFYYVLPELNEIIHNYKKRKIEERNKEILSLYDSGLSIRKISKEYGFSESVVEKCIYNNREINKNYKIRKISEKQEKEIINLYFSGYFIKDISKMYSVSDATISTIIKNFKNTKSN